MHREWMVVRVQESREHTDKQTKGDGDEERRGVGVSC